MVRHQVLQLKGNVIPRGLMPLERLFDKNDILTNPSKATQDEHVNDINIWTEEDPKVVKLSRGVPEEYQVQYIRLFQAYKYVFVWSYLDLKTFNIDVIQQKSPLKGDTKPHKKKTR